MMRNILLHVSFWLIFLLLWSAHDLNYHDNIWDNLTTNLLAFIPYSVLVYANLYYFMPKFLLNKRFMLYALILVMSIGIMTWISSAYLSFYFKNIDQYLPTSEFFASSQGKLAIAIEVILVLCLSMTLFLLDAWYRKDRLVKDIERKQLETELTLLKNQINPHFLFNSLNSIYVMLGRNLEEAKEMLMQFSDILSHQLYEANKKSVPLATEFENLKNYIAIETIRHNDLLKIHCDFPGVKDQLQISPMLLLPLVENAFKHGQSSGGYWIDLKASMDGDGTLNFKVSNSKSQSLNGRKVGNERGIGLSNVSRRLELLYPQKHILNIKENDETFTVWLKIKLDEHEVPNC